MSARSDRIKQGNAARERVLSGMYNQPTVEVQPQGNRRSMAVRSYQQQEEQRKQQVINSAPEITSNGGLDILKNSPWFKQPIVSEPVTTTPTRISTSVQRLVNQENKLENQGKTIAPLSKEDQIKKEREKQLEFFGSGPVAKGIGSVAEFIDMLRFGSPAGRTVERAASKAQEMMSPLAPRYPEVSTGSKALDIAADIAAYPLSFAVNPAQTEANLISTGYKAGENVLASALGSKATGAVSRGLQVANPMLNRAGMNIGSNTAEKIAQNLVRGGTSGAIAETAQGMQRGETSGKDIASNIALGAALGGVGDAAFGALGDLIKKYAKSKNITTNEAQEILSLPMGREDAARLIRQSQQETGVISPGEPLGLPEPKIPLSSEQSAMEAFNRIPSNRRQLAVQQQMESPIAPDRTDIEPFPNERGFISNLRSSENTVPEVVQGLENSANRTYKPITNAETLQRANEAITVKGVDAIESQLLNKSKFTADDVVQGMRVIQDLQSSGNVNRAVTMAEKLATKLTEAGQTVQAASIWNRLSPEGALLAAQRKVNKVNENLLKGQSEIKINDNQANDILSSAQAIQASGASKERAGQVIDIADRLKRGEQISPTEKKIVSDFVSDLKSFVKPSKPPKAAKPPKELADKRVRDRVVDFMDKQEQAALERIRARRGRLSSTPFDEWADYALVGASRLAKGAVKFSDWSASMINDFGDEIKPHLPKLFQRSQEELTQNSKKITEQVVSRAENIAENYLKKNESTISVEDADFIRNMARNVSSLSGDAQRLASQDLQEIMNGFEKAGVGRKISSAQYISMLLNPKTQIRNIVGNELMYRIERIARLIGTPIDIVASKVSGGPRQITFKSGPSIFDDFFTPSKDYFTKLPEGFRAGARGVSPEGLQSKYEIQGPAFRSKYNPLTYMEKALGASLQGFDYAAYTRATNQRMREMAYLDALNKGIKGNEAIRDYMQSYMANLDDATHAIARDYGKFSTLQNDSGLASKLMGFRRGVNQLTAGNKDFGVGSLVLPFAKTPANLLLRGIDYSPLGILKALKQTGDIILKKNTDLTRADVIDSVSRSLMGTGMGAVAYWLADKGAMFGQTNADPEVRKLQQLSGIKDFQINGSALKRMLQAITSGGDVDAAAKIQPGDTLWSYEWAQPTSMPLAIGSNIYQGVKEKKGAARTTGEAALSGLNTLLESSVLSGIQEAFKVPTGEDNAVKAIAMNLIKQVPSMATPSLVRNINTYLDNTVKETYDPDTATSIINPARSNIPGLSQQLPQRVDTLGKPQTKPNSFFDVFVSPADRSKYNPTKEAQLVIDLIKETGNNNLAPRAVAKYITGKDSNTGELRKVDLTPEQYVRLQTIVGQETNKRLGQIDNNLPTDKKVELVLKALTDSGKIGRNELKRELGISPTK